MGRHSVKEDGEEERGGRRKYYRRGEVREGRWKRKKDLLV